MIYRGTVKGKVIELEESLPYLEGQSVYISLEQIQRGSPMLIRKAMNEPPHLKCEDVDILEQEIEQSKLPMRQEGVFEEEN